MTEECITPLRRRMIEDMSVRHFASKTQHDYVRAVMKLTRFLGRSPDTATNEDLRRFQLRLTENRAGAPIITKTAACRPRRSLNTPKRPQRLTLLYRRRRLDSLNPCSISFSDQIPMEGRANKCRGAFCDGCDRPGLVGNSRRDRGPIALARARPPNPRKCWRFSPTGK